MMADLFIVDVCYDCEISTVIVPFVHVGKQTERSKHGGEGCGLYKNESQAHPPESCHPCIFRGPFTF